MFSLKDWHQIYSAAKEDEQASILRMMLKSNTNPENEPINQDNTLKEMYMKSEDIRRMFQSIPQEKTVTMEDLEELFNDSPKSHGTRDLFNSPQSRGHSEASELPSPQILSAQSSEEMDLGQLDEIFSQTTTNMPYEKQMGCSSSYEETQPEVQKPSHSRFDAGTSAWPKRVIETRREPLLRTQTRPEEHSKPKCDFITARKELQVQNLINYGKDRSSGSSGSGGPRRVGLRKPLTPKSDPAEDVSKKTSDDELCEQLSHIDPKIIEMIRNEIMMKIAVLQWKDIIGLTFAKKIIQEAIVLPMLRPDIFTGIRRPPRGILLFGPPGTGKTLIGKCIASQAKATFFNISASTLTSKYIGEGEKMVRGLFAVASAQQPSVIFIDEVDSLLCQRSENEHESSRRLKTEFLIHLDGAATNENEIVLVVGATNRPQELDEAVRRRFVKRLYIPLPIAEARLDMVKSLFAKVTHNLSEKEMAAVSEMTEGFSGADMKSLCQEASMGPIRSIPMDKFQDFSNSDLRPVIFQDFQTAMQCVRASVSPEDIESYLKWDKVYGSGGSGGKGV